ncbi:hypothetical protein ACQ4LE_005015 [Meloidogyne hapla]
MAQPSPPTDDELHLKGLQEGTEDNDNFIEESDWTRRIAGAGDGNRKVPNNANRIIDEAKLNQLLPRLNSVAPTTSSSTSTASTPSTTFKNSSKLTEETTPVELKNETTLKTTLQENSELNNKNELINSTILIPKSEEFGKKKTKKDKRKKSSTNTVTLIKSEEKINLQNTSTKIPPKLETQSTTQTTKIDTTSTNLEGLINEEKLNSSPLRVDQSKSLIPNLNETELIGIAKMENETAQLIAAIENVLADAEVGPNAKYWLHEVATASTLGTSTFEDFNETTTITSTNTSNYDKTENQTLKNETKENLIQQKTEKSEIKEEEDEESEEDDETEENDQELLENKENGLKESFKDLNNLTTKIKDLGENTTKNTIITTKVPNIISDKLIKKKDGIKYIPEAEEEEQAADIASLQLDSVAAPVLPESSNISVIKATTSMPETSKTTVHNLFNLPNNSTMPNFSTMIKPVNSIIDGIGPLILPLIGYSRQALDSYSLNNNLLPGVPVSRQQIEIRSSPQVQQQPKQQRSLIEEILSRPFASPLFASPFVTQQNEEEKQLKEQEQQRLLASEPPSLELLDKIVEQRRHRENTANELMMKRLRENKAIEQNTVITPQATTIIALPPSDSGYDNGRNVVLNNFHEDSGLIRKSEQGQKAQTQESQGSPPSAQRPQGFGGGKRPNSISSPFRFLSSK